MGDINRSVMGENDEVLGPAREGRDDGSYKIDENLLLSKKKNKVKLFLCQLHLLSTFNFQLYFLFDKRKIQNGRFPQIALASRGGKRQEKIGLHYSLSNLNTVCKNQ